MPPRPRTSLPPRNSRQQAILQFAEQLFAQRGFHAVTLRQIADLAKVPLALVGYYFNHKEGLFQAVFAHRSALHRELEQALDEARRTAGQDDGLRRVIDALVQPMLKMRQDPSSRHYARLLARALTYPESEAEPALQQHLDPLLQRFLDALQTALPQASHAELAAAWRFAIGAVLVHVGEPRLERLLPAEPGGPADTGRLNERILAGIRAGMARRAAPGPARSPKAQR